MTVTSAASVIISTTSAGNSVSTYTLSGYGSEVNLYARPTSTVTGATYNYTWTVAPGGQNVVETNNYYNGIYGYDSSVLYVRGIAPGTTTISVSITQTLNGATTTVGTASISITVSNTGLQPSVTVYGGYDYLFSETDANGKASVASQIASLVSNNTGRYLYSVVFTSTTNTYGDLSAVRNTTYYANGITSSGGGRLSDIVFTPRQTGGTATFSFIAYYAVNNGTPGPNDYLSGYLSITVTGSVYVGDITYSAAIGDDVPFALRDFEDFYYNKTKGTLNYVTFSLPSGGALYADSGRLSTGNACYASPTRAQTDLAGVYFSPTGTTATRANTVHISFTAYGTRYNTASSSVSGTVIITYLAGSARDITYNIYTSGALNPNDFTDAYRQVIGGTAPTGLTIEFQGVPTYGSLSYKDSSRANSSAVALRAGNIKSYKFTTRTTGTNQLGDVTYTASGSRSDTIEYIAYVNNTPQFTGKVVFNSSDTSAAKMQVSFTCTSSQGIAFTYGDFYQANAAMIAMTSYIHFLVLPTNGTLTFNGAPVTASTNVAPVSLGSVAYRPNAGFNNNTDRISFQCYDANNNSVGSGQVNIVVTGNGGSAATSVSQFKDVSASAWYRNDLITLMSAGIIKGRGDGKFDPTAELTYGEALKIFVLAAGYPAQPEATGKDWAINYKKLAVGYQWISDSVDLSAKISRNAMAELAAKALGVSPTDGVPPVWKDGTSNGYANALYYTNPQILQGNGDGTFKGTSTLLRQEICAIAARVLSYKGTQQSSERPGWLG